MIPTSLIIVTDRGGLKAYKVNETATRGASLQLLQAFDTTEAHGRLQDKVTDQAGRFSSANGGTGMHSGTAERTGIDTETDRRICKQLADEIVEICQRDAAKGGWSFAAPASIHSAVVELLPKDVKARIVEHVKSDLIRMEAAEMATHFRSLQAI